MTSISEHLKELITEPETTEDVTPETVSVEGEQVTDEPADDVATDADGEASTVSSSLPDNLTDDPRIRAWQAANDKRTAAATARIAELEATLAATPEADTTDPMPALEKQRATLLESFTESDEAMKKATGEERDALLITQWQLRRQIFDADVQKYSHLHGADPKAKEFGEAYDNGEVSSPRDVERLALLVAKGGQTSTTRADSLDARAAALKERESAIEALLKQERAKLRRELGLDDVPGATAIPAGKVSPEDKVLQKYRAIIESGETGRMPVKELLKLKLEHPEVFAQ